ncbi:MAG: 50S ribosomal protein L35 [Phycisphaerales bacterium]|nr:50S ribosomal protein L35 [Phycisphaerales bacterium]
MPKAKSHKGLLKRIRITKSGKVKFRPPRGRHLKSNKTGIQVQSYRNPGYASSGDMRKLSALLFRPLKSQEQSIAERKAREEAAMAEPAAN